jgi:sec-independent protein translocase protein TatC
MLITFMLIFGLVFEMPLVASVLAMLGLLKPEMLTRFWRHVILVCFVLGAVLSPGGEPMSMIMMSGSMVFLYAISILLTKMLYPREAGG